MVEEKTETREFQAEVKKMLDIVINSLYTERDIFLRELISNSADALEKFRHESLIAKEVFDENLPLEIKIDCDAEAHTLTITDTGIGMTKVELEENLGTIAHSGSKTFLSHLSETDQKEVNLIGQFGVGFYAAFMVGARVRVQSRSYLPDEEGHEWSSDGSGTYDISPCPGIRRGTRIIIELKDDAREYAEKENIERIIKQYSSFVSFPIKVDDETVNTVQALWTKSKNEITEEEYTDFYKFIGNAFDVPLFRLHFNTDAPLAIKSLLFTPRENFESFGFGRLDPGVNLYCQKVLIEQHSKNILPEWLRFVKGVVDSEDLPLNISRQALQDSALVVKINKILTGKYLKHLQEMAKNEPEKYTEFWKNFGIFLKEGATTDYTHREEISKLLRFESSRIGAGELTSLAEYVARMQDDQKDIYYINGPSREAIENGPYVEAFKKRDIEIIYTLEPIDDFVLTHLGEFDEKKLISADRADIELPDDEKKAEEKDDKAETGLTGDKVEELTKWMKEALGEQVKEIHVSKRLVDSPAIIVNPDGYMTSSMERIMQAQSPTHQIREKNLEINAGHDLIVQLDNLRTKDEQFAKDILQQIYDNAMIQAGLMVEPRKMVEHSYKILERAVKGE